MEDEINPAPAASSKILIARDLIVSGTKLLQHLIWAGALVAVFWIIYLIAQELSGELTQADINIHASVEASGSLSVGGSEPAQKERVAYPSFWWFPGLLGLIVGIGGIAYGRAQAQARKDVIEYFHPMQLRYEKSKDPNRTTSKLTKRGETRPEDQ